MNTKAHEGLSEEEIQELMAKYDPEAGSRKLYGTLAWIAAIGLLAFSLFQMYTAVFGIYTAQIQRTVHLGFALALIFILFPASKKMLQETKRRFQITWYDTILAGLSIVVGAYWPINISELVLRVGRLTTLDLLVGFIAILLVLEATRRVVGMPITIIAIVFLLYAYFGPYMPGFLQHRGLEIDRIIRTMFFTTEGILGTPLAVSSTYIFLFLVFGAFLIKTGVGEYFNDLALVVAGKSVGGPAKVAVFSSALQGTISGSSVANVVTSGAFTIPMMKKLGYNKNFAGAVEAASSTGGQIMPPIMGAAAFLMVEFIGGGITYWDVASAAVIPALLYFTGIWIMTHFEAKRIGLRGLDKEELPKKKTVMKKLYLLIPIVVVVVLLMLEMSVVRAALWSIVSTVVVGMINSDVKMGFKEIIDALIDGARTALSVAAACACAGIIVGVVTVTGLGLKFANGLIDLSDGVLFLTLFFTMIASLILGMGSPTTANYIITATIAAPALLLLGVPDLAAHMFVFYFGIVADITPPVALAAFAAAGVSGGDPLKTGVHSAKLAIAAFVIPYIFIYSPEMLLIDTGWMEVTTIVITSFLGMIGIGAGMIGFWVRKSNPIERVLAVVSGVLLIIPDLIPTLIGLVIFVGLLAIQYMTKNKYKTKEKALNT